MSKKQYLSLLLTMMVSGLFGGAGFNWFFSETKVSAQSNPSVVVTAQEFRLVDKDGNLRAILSDSPSVTSGETPSVLIELYTSEGCSSCPAADHWLSQLRDDPRLWQTIVPIALHVDYWDSLGWRDPFATTAHTARQRTYAGRSYKAGVYPRLRRRRSGMARMVRARSVDSAASAGNRAPTTRGARQHASDAQFCARACSG